MKCNAEFFGLKKLPVKITKKLLQTIKDGGFQTILIAKSDKED